MYKIAVLLTCYNRRSKTIKCLENLFIAQKSSKESIEITVFLTDDGSTDGTVNEIQAKFYDKRIRILQGDGSLFWAGGMRNSYQEAKNSAFDLLFLLNDDTFVFPYIFNEVFNMLNYAQNKHGSNSILCGITCASDMRSTTYGGRFLINKFLYTSKLLDPNGTFQECDLGNANIMIVPYETTSIIGFLDKKYKHGAADFDYTLTAKKHGVTTLVSSQYLGICDNDHASIYESYSKGTLKERIETLNSPLGLAFKDQLYYMRKHFPLRLPIFYLIGIFKSIFPHLYLKFAKSRLQNRM